MYTPALIYFDVKWSVYNIVISCRYLVVINIIFAVVINN